MTSITAQPSSNIIDTFKHKLHNEWKSRACCGREYFRANDITQWMLRTDTNKFTKNCVALLEHVQNHERDRPSRLSAADISADEQRCLIVFAILLDLGFGHVVDVFQRSKIIDNRLDAPIGMTDDLEADLQRRHVPNPKTLLQSFEDRKFMFLSTPFTLDMRAVFRDPGRGRWRIPYCKRERINYKGGTAQVWQVAIPEPFLPKEFCDKISRSRYEDPEYGACYHLALKTFEPANADIFYWERDAYLAVQGQPGMVQYLGEYEIDESIEDGAVVRTRNILLEFGDSDLDEYFASPHRYPPNMNAEILAFWSSLINVAEALEKIHNLKFERENGSLEEYHGWHADLKPDNIVRVHGKFKLADFGFAKFKKKNLEHGVPATEMNGGTETYGSPECDVYRRNRGTISPVTQKIDTWSFGCVLSVSATWIVLGFQGVLAYEHARELAITRLRERKRNGESISTPKSNNAFHDGETVLPEVTEWHSYLRTVMRKSDTATGLVLDLIDREMLQKEPKNRLDSRNLCDKLLQTLAAARSQYGRLIERTDLEPVAENVINSLLDYDLDAHSQLEDNRAGNTTNDSRPGFLNTLQVLDIPRRRSEFKSTRVNKPELMQQIKPGVVAHRTDALNKPGQPSRIAQPENSKTPQKSRSIMPDIVESPEQQDNSFGEPLHPKSLASSDYVLSDGFPDQDHSTKSANTYPPKEYGTSSSHTYQHNFTPNYSLHTAEDNLQRKEGVTVVTPSIHHPADANAANGLNIGLGSEDHTTVTSDPDTIATTGVQASKVSQLPNRTEPWSMQRPGTGLNLDPAIELLKPNADWPIFQAWTAQKDKATWVSKFLGSSGDQHLKIHLNDRDIKIVVDNADSMRPFWNLITMAVETIAGKIGKLDKDGIDLEFTLGDDNNIYNASYDKVLAKLKSARRQAFSGKTEGVPPRETDMAQTLSKIFDRYLKNGNRAMTLIILTDGLWEGTVGSTAVETMIVEFLQKPLISNKINKRWFTIEFISFGNKGLNKLEYLDDKLEEKYQIPDIIDTEPISGDVYKMILGSWVSKYDQQKTPTSSVTHDPYPTSSTPRSFTSTTNSQPGDSEPSRSMRNENRLSSLFRTLKPRGK